MAQRIFMEFGTGSFVRDYQYQNIADLSDRDQALALGWSDGCPVPLELTDPNNAKPGRGPENMISRYGEVNFWFGQIVREVEEDNPELAAQLMQNVYREASEPVGKYEPESVPEEYLSEMAPMNTIAGYALPRLFTASLHTGAPDTESISQRMSDGLDIIADAAVEAESPASFLAIVANLLSERGALPNEVILKNVLSAGWLGEHNAQGMLNGFKAQLKEHAPNLYAEYAAMSDEDKRLQKLA